MKCLILFAVLLVQQIQAEKIVYHQYMTPEWIMNNAAFVHSTGSLTNNRFQFTGTTSAAFTRLVLVNLISSSTVDVNEDITVKIVVSMDQAIGNTSDSDIIFTISDTVASVGGFTVDRGNTASGSFSCSGVEGKSGLRMTNPSYRSYLNTGPKDLSYPAEHTFYLKLQQKRGSCFVPVEHGGFTNTFSYTQKLRQDKGLDLEVDKSDVGEKVGIKYIIVTIMKEN